MREPVIYKIINTINGKFYVGSTGNMYERTRCHRNRLRRGKHHCKHLQAAWNKYGEKFFVFAVVEKIESYDLLQKAEDVWLQEHVGKDYCYNASLYSDAPMRGIPKEKHPNFGIPVPEKQRKLISKSLRAFYASDSSSHPRLGKRHSAETVKKISEKMQAAAARGAGGKYKRSTETIKKLSESHKGNSYAKGYKRTERECQAISERMKGNSLWLGKKHSEESKLKMGRPIIVTDPSGTERHYGTITLFRAESGLLIPTVQRALKSGEPLKKGPFKGYSFRYA